MTTETSFFASESDVSVSLFNAAGFATGSATMMNMTTAVDEAGFGTRKKKIRRRKLQNRRGGNISRGGEGEDNDNVEEWISRRIGGRERGVGRVRKGKELG